MKKFLCSLILLFQFTPSIFADNYKAKEFIHIEYGDRYDKYSEKELRRRIWTLEKAVWELQQRLGDLEKSHYEHTSHVAKPETKPETKPEPETWVCRLKSRNDIYSKTGSSKSIASHNVLEACKTANNGDGFFCQNTPTCSNN